MRSSDFRAFFQPKNRSHARLRRLGDFILIAGILPVIADNFNYTPKKISLMDKGPTYDIAICCESHKIVTQVLKNLNQPKE